MIQLPWPVHIPSLIQPLWNPPPPQFDNPCQVSYPGQPDHSFNTGFPFRFDSMVLPLNVSFSPVISIAPMVSHPPPPSALASTAAASLEYPLLAALPLALSPLPQLLSLYSGYIRVPPASITTPAVSLTPSLPPPPPLVPLNWPLSWRLMFMLSLTPLASSRPCAYPLWPCFHLPPAFP